MIKVTQPFLPPLEEYQKYLEQIWEEKWITNGGRFHQELEHKMSQYLGVEHLSLFSNGTLALMVALQVLKIEGEVITTPYSFVATSHSLWWNGITPVFVDVNPVDCNLNPDLIEAAITDKTTAIMPVHVYGNPCDTEKIDAIAKKYNLKVIYDAAHAFNVKQDNKTILNSGDLSILSFHATKVFNTVEGGAIISPDAETKKMIDYLKNFGFENETTVVAPGINSKMNELQSAYGLLQLKFIDNNISKRKSLTELYKSRLEKIDGVELINSNDNITYNYSYMPVFIKESYKKSRNDLYDYLKSKDILSRRYFYPLITEFPVYNDLPTASKRNLPIANMKAEEVLCLPLYEELTEKQVNLICDLIRDFNS